MPGTGAGRAGQCRLPARCGCREPRLAGPDPRSRHAGGCDDAAGRGPGPWGATRGIAVTTHAESEDSMVRRSAPKDLKQYECGRFRFSDRATPENYDRHLVFDHVVSVEDA